MLILLQNLDPLNQEKCRQNGWVALDPKTGASLRKSRENFGSNHTPAQYFLSIPNLMVLVIWALTDEEAMASANKGQR